MAETVVATSVPSTAPRSTGNAWLVVAFMFGHFTHHVSNTLLAPLMPLIRDAFTLTYAQSGLLVSAFSLSLGLSQAPVGLLADRIGSRTVITAGLILTGLLTFAIGLSGEYWLLLVLLVCLGLVGGSYHAPAASLLAQVFARGRRGSALGVHIVGGNLSFFATPLLAGGLAAATHSWQTPYLAFAIAPVLAGVFLIFVLPKTRQTPAMPRGEKTSLRGDLWVVLQVVGPLLGLAILFQMTYAAIYGFLALYLVDAREFSVPMAAVLVSVPYIGGLLGAPAGGYLSDRIGRKAVIVSSLCCVGPLFLLFTQAPNLLLVPVLLLIGFISSARMPVIEGFLLDRAPDNRRATTLGAYYLVAQELGGLAAPILGAAAGIMGIAQAFGAAGMGLTALSVLVLIFHRKL